MKTTIRNLRRIIRNVIQESMDPATKRNLDNLEEDMTIRHWQDFKDVVMRGDYDSAFEFLSEIGCDDRMDQEAFIGDATELTADELAKEWQYRLEQLVNNR